MVFLSGWKGIANYVGRHPRTIKRWHYEKVRLPFNKTAPGKGGKIFVHTGVVDQWIKIIVELNILAGTCISKLQIEK